MRSWTYQHTPSHRVPSLFTGLIVNQSRSDPLFSSMYFISACSSCTSSSRWAGGGWRCTWAVRGVERLPPATPRPPPTPPAPTSFSRFCHSSLSRGPALVASSGILATVAFVVLSHSAIPLPCCTAPPSGASPGDGGAAATAVGTRQARPAGGDGLARARCRTAPPPLLLVEWARREGRGQRAHSGQAALSDHAHCRRGATQALRASPSHAFSLPPPHRFTQWAPRSLGVRVAGAHPSLPRQHARWPLTPTPRACGSAPRWRSWARWLTVRRAITLTSCRRRAASRRPSPHPPTHPPLPAPAAQATSWAC